MTEERSHKAVPRILITGASRGIGLEFTRQYLSQGRHVLACCRTPETASHLHNLTPSPGRLEIIPMDVADETSIAASRAIVRQQVSGLDILINNAGVFPTAETTLDAFDLETMMATFRVNTAAPLAVVQRFRDLLKKGNQPRLINIGSAAGSFGALHANPSTGQYSYKCSKAALHMATCLVANELKTEGIIVMAMRPGWVQTDMTSHKGTLTAAESVQGMIKVIDQATLAESGKFLTWEGSEYPW